MELVTPPVLAVAGNFLSDYRSLSDDGFQDYFDTAANRTAEEFGIKSDANTYSLADLERLACAELLKTLNAR